MNYKTKRNIIIISIIAILFIISFVSTYFYIKANNEAQAVSENNSNSDVNQNEQSSTENNNQQNNTEQNEESNVEENNSEENNSQETATEVADNNNNENNTTTQNNAQTQTITTIQKYETESTVVYFSSTNLDLALDELNVNIPNLTASIEAVTGKENNYVATENEITYNIQINNNKEEKLEQLEVSTMVPTGTELVEDTISDNGIIENGKITWTVDVADSKTVSYTVKVIGTTGNIVATAIVNGIDTNEVTNTKLTRHQY